MIQNIYLFLFYHNVEVININKVMVFFFLSGKTDILMANIKDVYLLIN